MLATYLRALGLTLAVELPIVLLILRGAPRGRVLAAFFAGNLATHLTIHFLLPRAHLGPAAFYAVAEALAMVAEAALYSAAIRPRSPWLAVAAAAGANGASYVLGLLLLT